MDRFEDLLNRFGSRIERWSAGDRAEAEALIAADAGAAKLHREAQRLDALVGELVQPVAMDAAAMGRIMSGIDHNRHREVALQPTRRFLAWAGAAMAVFLVVGYAAGVAIPAGDGEDTLAGLIFGGDTATVDSGSVL